MSIVKRERWAEDDVSALPAGEHDYFDRKSGALLADRDFEEKLAKVLSAFANSGGGHLVLGVKNDGTFDGVPQIHKGRQSTREWLEQVIPNRLSYPLQDFRVHEVEPSTPSAIPAGKVLIVIDVGDSNLAPHQSIFTYIYYHRVGGHSKPAPHFYLETLRGRGRYPSREVAQTWCYVVLNPLISILNYEQQYLTSRWWTWKVDGLSLTELSLISSRSNQGDHEEFLEFYPKIEKGMVEHDLKVIAVNGHCSNLYRAIVTSSQLLDAFQETISPDELQRLRESEAPLAQYKTDEALLDKVLGSQRSVEDNLKYLAEYVVNRSINPNSIMRPLWEMHKEKYLQVLNGPPLNDFDAKLNNARDDLQRFNIQFIIQLKEVRRKIVRQHGIPVEQQLSARLTTA